MNEMNEKNQNIIYTEEYILNELNNKHSNLENNLGPIIIKNIYKEEFIEKIIYHLDLKKLVKNNILSDFFLNKYVYPECDDHELLESNITNIVNTTREILKDIRYMPDRDNKIKNLNNIEKKLIKDYATPYTEEEIFKLIDTNMYINLNTVFVRNYYTEDFMEKIINLYFEKTELGEKIDLTEIVKNNYLSDKILESIIKRCDIDQIKIINNYIKKQRNFLNKIKSNPEEYNLNYLNKINSILLI
jgi:hypothetical protein